MGFFDLFDEKKIVRGDETVKVKSPIKHKEYSCAECGLCDTCSSPKLTYRGNGEKKVLIVTDKPSKDEDEAGFLGHGANTMFLKETLKSIGINLFKDAWLTSAVQCYGKKRSTFVVDACRKRLKAVIDELKPKVVILLGPDPFHSLIQPRISGRMGKTMYSDLYGEQIPDQELGFFVCPTYDAAYLRGKRMYDDGGESDELYKRDPSMYKTWKAHLKSAFELSKSAFYAHNYAGDCFTTLDESQAIQWLTDALKWAVVSFDYETNSLRPYRIGSKLVCVSISDGLFSFAFPVFESKAFKRAYRRLVYSDIPKISHNLTMEAIWTRHRYGHWIDNWKDDTLLAQHCLYNQKPTNLKFCVYANFGIAGYDAAIEPYIRPTPEEEKEFGENAFNRIEKAPIEDVLKYCALDSLFTAKLAVTLRSKMDKFATSGYEFFVESANTLAKMSFNGLRIDESAFERAGKLISEKLKEVEAEFYAHPDVAKWDGDSPISISSTPQLSHLVYDIMKVKPVKFTDKGTPSLDKEAIDKLNVPVLNIVKKYREFDKMRSTVVEGWKREAIDGVVHPNFNLGTTDTFRSSSTAPNAQNNYKRDPDKKKIARSIIIPRKGNRLVEYDFKQLEIIINACHSQDKNIIRYLKGGNADMHLDATMDCFLLDAVAAKEHRSAIKSLFTFSAFYGNWYGQMAKGLYEYAQEVNLLPHLKSKGIKTYPQFEAHIKKAEDILWNERFPEHRAWMKEQYVTYLEQGYLDTYTGFRPKGPMKRNVAYNIKIQGDGFHVLLWGVNQVQKKMEDLERSFIVNEIHDSLVVDCHPSEEGLIDAWVYKYFTQEVRKHWPWITIPLVVEKERGEIDGSWDKMSAVGILTGD